MIRAVEKVRARLDRAVVALGNTNIPYAVAGGNAVAAWISRVDEAAVRTPVDVEMVLRREDIEGAITALEAAGFRYPKGAWFFLDGPNNNPRDGLFIFFAGEKFLGTDDSGAPDVTEVDSSGRFPIIDLEPLVRMKLVSYRFKDRVDVLDLINVGLINESWSTRFTGELAARLQRLLDDPDKFGAFARAT